MDKLFPQSLTSADHKPPAREVVAAVPVFVTGHKPFRASSCGKANRLIRNREFNPSTDVHRLVHRRRAGRAHRGEVGRLPHSRFRRNVNRPRDTAARKSGGAPGRQANRPGSPTRRFGRSSDRNVRQAGSRLQFATVSGSTTDRRTGSGSRDDAVAIPWDAQDQERDRIQLTALAGSPATAPTPRP